MTDKQIHAKEKSENATCSGVIKLERERFEERSGGKPARKSCLFINWSPIRIKLATQYFELADELEELGIPLDVFYECVPKSIISHGGNDVTMRPLNFDVLKRSSSLRKKGIDYIFKCCSNMMYVKPKSLIAAMDGMTISSITSEQIDEHYKPSVATRAKASKLRRHKSTTVSNPAFTQSERKIECDPVIRNVLLRIVTMGKAEDEYGALMYCIKLGAESVASQTDIPAEAAQ